ncbi:MAG: hypothetical protein A2Y41_03150 [Spirochaetes bacterium GWB1_36_13]|nr:MAG: hypothetical protein A2Y41_03150 [Spirochaetes bacterium GWB1_36_13]
MSVFRSKILPVQKKIQNGIGQSEANELIQNLVNELLDLGYDKEKIKKLLFSEDLSEAQGNKEMIKNNEVYKQAIAKALGD